MFILTLYDIKLGLVLRLLDIYHVVRSIKGYCTTVYIALMVNDDAKQSIQVKKQCQVAGKKTWLDQGQQRWCMRSVQGLS